MTATQRGSLEEIGVPQILRPLVKGRRTGVLRFTRGRMVKTVYVSEGRLIFATSTDPDDRLGEMLLRKGLIPYRVLEDSVQAIKAGKRQGTILVENGAIRSRHLVEGVMDQVQEIIYSLFPFDDGEYEFIEGELPSREVIVLRMSTPDILMEGVRRIQGWRRIREALGGLEQTYALGPASATALSNMSLQKEELGLVASIDGILTVEEICAAGTHNDFVTCRTIYGLWAAGVLDRVPQDRDDSDTREKTEPHAEKVRGASVAREIDRFNELHRFLFELVNYELQDRAGGFFEKAFAGVSAEHADLYDGVAVDSAGELDPFALRKNIAGRSIGSYLRGLDRLIEIESDLVREILGERKAAIIEDGLLSLKQRQLEGKPSTP